MIKVDDAMIILMIIVLGMCADDTSRAVLCKLDLTCPGFLPLWLNA